ncbi:MAG: aromatic ring-hydroxylating dioxygenase subunit alpha [Acidobacteria bacterium]|nr:aromatic ring-hydroxylating dioxygenase subunit alpha [Acidobacteriota bacterium]
MAAGAAAVAFPSMLRANAPSDVKPAIAGAVASTGESTRKTYSNGWREGTTIPAEYYLDAKHYNTDERYIAENLWLMADHVNRIPKAGDYFVFEFGRAESVIILRNTSGEIKAYHNVCRHRGSRLCRHREDPRPDDPRLSVLQLGSSGNTPVFRCPYHAWTYDLDGNLISAHNMQKDFDMAKNGLIPCHMRIAEGHIFLNFSREKKPPKFDTEEVEYLRKMGQKYGLADLKIAVRQYYPIKANWKLAIENFLECYHCGSSHRNLVTTHNWDDNLSPDQKARLLREMTTWACEEAKEKAGEAQGMGSGGSSWATEYSGELNPGFLTGSVDGKPVAPLLPRIKKWTHCTDLATTAHSTGYWQAYDDHVAVARFTPRAPEFTDCEIFWLVNPKAVEGKDYEPERVMSLWDITIREDIWIVENNHLGVTSRAYGPGRYAEHEGSPARFIKWYMDEVVKA